MFPKIVQKLIDLFVKFPTVGPRTAARFVFYLIKLPQEKVEELVRTISELKKEIKLCGFCFKPFQPPSAAPGAAEGGGFCEICSNPVRDKSLLCLVEKETDLESIEKTQQYKGIYFVLGSSLAARSAASELDRAKAVRLKELIDRIKNPQNFGIYPVKSDKVGAFPKGKQFNGVKGADFQEIIIATNPTTEGEATAIYIEKNLKSLGKKITRLGLGLPTGGELEYADEETLKSAFESRK